MQKIDTNQKKLRFKTSKLRSDLCEYSDAYVVSKGTIAIADLDNNKKLAFTNNDPFFGCMSKINNALIDNSEGLDIVIPMYNLIDYGKNY